MVQDDDEEYSPDDDVFEPHDAVGLADYLSSTFGSDLPPNLQDELILFVASHQDGLADGAVLSSTATGTAGELRHENTVMAVLPAVLATAAGIVGGALTAEQPLMDAGLDSLGVAQSWRRRCLLAHALCEDSQATCPCNTSASNATVMQTTVLDGLLNDCLQVLRTCRCQLNVRTCFAGAVELRNALQDSFSVDLPATMALDYPTAAAIAAHIATLLPQAAPDPAPTKAMAVLQRALPAGQLRLPKPVATRHRPRIPMTSVMVGLSARFPGPALDAAGFWHNINGSIDLPEPASARVEVCVPHTYVTQPMCQVNVRFCNTQCPVHSLSMLRHADCAAQGLHVCPIVHSLRCLREWYAGAARAVGH